MKAYRNLPSILLFCSFLLSGFWLGRAAFDSPPASWARRFFAGQKLNPVEHPAPALANGQRNILVIGVDDLDSPQPRLESVWLILYILDRPQVTLLPIYPGPAAPAHPAAAQILGDQFKLDPHGAPDPVFMEALQGIGLWWSGYVLVDEVAVAEIVEAASKLKAHDSDSISGVRAVAEVPPAWSDPDGSFMGQVKLVQTICQYAKGPPSKMDVSQLLDLIPHHANTDLNLTKAAAELKSILTHADGLSCEFPTIKGSLQVFP